MKRFINSEDWHQMTLLPACLDDYMARTSRCVSSTSSLTSWIFNRWVSIAGSRSDWPPVVYHPAVLLRLYIYIYIYGRGYGYLIRIKSRRRRRAKRNAMS